MSKMSELSMVLDEMIRCGEDMIKAAKTLKALFTETSTEPEQPVPAEKKEEKTYTFADVRKAFAAKSHAGHTAEVKALIGKYGAERLSDIKEADYPALMADLEVI